MHYRLQFFDDDGAVICNLEWGCEDERRALALLAHVGPNRTVEMRRNGRLVMRQEAKPASGHR